MIEWILYAIAVGAVLSAAGNLLDRSLRLAGRSTRWSWLLAMLTSGLFLLPPWFGANDGRALGAGSGARLALSRDWTARLDRMVLLIWVGATLVLLVRLF